jgi:hypothetical protein
MTRTEQIIRKIIKLMVNKYRNEFTNGTRLLITHMTANEMELVVMNGVINQYMGDIIKETIKNYLNINIRHVTKSYHKKYLQQYFEDMKYPQMTIILSY